ncbi:MAG TPA: hypothetical protein VM582_08985, partial [Candidatus Thermoplasmatota archaeon]|nr:hypothetical protein [Candidatus Thermoplasmatota archaeon]
MRHARRALLVALLVLPLLVPAQAEESVREVRVALDGLVDVARLEPYDPRSPALAQSAAPARGLWTGALAGTGGLVRLVEGPGWGVALVERAPASSVAHASSPRPRRPLPTR